MKYITPVKVLVACFTLIVLSFIYSINADAATSDDTFFGLFNYGGQSTAMECYVDGEQVDCPGGKQRAGEIIENKLTHAVGFLIFVLLVALTRAPFIRQLIVPHHNVTELFEKNLKDCLLKEQEVSDAEYSVFKYMVAKDIVSYAVVIIGGVYILCHM